MPVPGGLLLIGAAIQGAIGVQLPLLLVEIWLIVCWFGETGIVKPGRTG